MNGNDGIINGASETSGIFGRCYHFDENKNIIFSEQYSPSESITYAFWFYADELFTYPENFQYTGRIPFHRRGGYADHWVSFWTNQIHFTLYDINQSIVETNVLVGAWNHIAFGFNKDTKNMFLYYNGEKIIDVTREGNIDWSHYYASYFGFAPDTPSVSRWIGK